MPAAPQTRVVGEADAGRTVQARIGDTVQVRLVESFPVPGSSLVWDVSSSAPSVLAPGSVTRDPAERPRVGQVAYTAEFSAKSGGQAQLIARGSTTCEAMAKQSCPNQDFTITVVVS
jgi:predicted secreted protein